MTRSRDASRARRTFAFTHAVAAHRRAAPSSATVTEHLANLIELAVPDFARWCAVASVDASGHHELLDARRAGCVTSGDHTPCCVAALEGELAEYEDLVRRASRTSSGQSANPEGSSRVVAVALRSGGHVFAVVLFGFDDDVEAGDVDAVEDAAWLIDEALERSAMTRASRAAMRQTQRIASQLHQLIAASLLVAGRLDEVDLLERLAESARAVFNADLATVALGSRRAVAERGRPTALVEGLDDGAWLARPLAREAWREGPWLVVPLPGRRDLVGVVAVRRDDGPDFSDEDREVITLLAQMVATSIGAAELSRGIQTSEARLRVLIDSAPVGIVEIDEGGAIRHWNRAASRVFAWGEPGGDGAVVFPESTREGFAELWASLRRDGARATQDFVDVEIAGRLRFLTASAAVLPEVAGVSPGVLALVDDVTDHRQLLSEMRHAQTMETRGQVASKLAHDFNNLLTLITGYAELLALDVASDERAADMVRGIQATTSRASLLTGQLQTIGRTKVAAPVLVSPQAVVRSNAEVLERILGPSIELRLTLSDEGLVVRVDPDQFEQMVLNLALNARDAMPDGGELRVTIDGVEFDEVSAETYGVPTGAYARLEVGDDGVGMDEATRARCFEPLFTTKGPFKGTGLGLAAARRFVEEGGGTIQCRSTPKEGTTFTILLPHVGGVAEDLATTAGEVRVAHAATIMVVEDDDGLRRLMSQVLRRNGFRVVEADCAEAALAHLESVEEGLDLLVSDVLMGAISGAELATTLQSRDGALRVLLVSGTETDAVLQGLAPGTSAFLAKPFKPSQLIDFVDELLSRRANAPSL